MRVGDVILIEPNELVAGGDALARIDGFPIFASAVFPGDIARVRLYEVKKGYAKAELVELVRPSPWRRTAPCPIAGECGGCNWTALRLDRQLEAKRRILTESLRRIGKFDPVSLPPIRVHPSPLNYRLRSRLHRDDTTGAVGFYALRSHRVVPLVPECEVVGVKTARRFAGERSDEEGSVEIWEVDGRTITDEREATLIVDHHTYQLSTRSFFQVNRHLLATMVRLLRENAARVSSRRRALDLYAGVGFFTAPLAGLFERVEAIEGSPVSARYARRNAAGNVTVVEAAVENAIHRMEPADLIFLDPPRAGARPEVVDVVARKAREMICYLSCDPVTFARDAKRLIASGWQFSTLDLLDLFPNTHHVETLSSLTRAG